MNQNEFDPLDSLLEGIGCVPQGLFVDYREASEVRERLLRKTQGVVRRRRYFRRAKAVGQIMAVYLAGVCTVLLVRTEAANDSAPGLENAVVESEAVPASNGRTPQSGEPSKPQPAPQESVPLERLEPWELRARVASASREEQLRLLRLAGDRYLEYYSDISGAVLCYQQFLELAGPESLESVEEDSWLLADLKYSRRQKNHL